MKYWCEHCKSVLDEDDLELYQEPSEAWGHTVYEDWWVCPNCGHVVVEYEHQDKECEDCVLFEQEECPWGGHFDHICGDFVAEDE